MSPRPSIHLSLVLACLAVPALAQQQSAPPRPAIDPRLYAGLSWRNVGPFRGGRVSATAGAIGQPGVFYAGYPGGGVWKTTSAGATWFPVFDSVRDVSSIGSVEVAPSNPDVVYVGAGDMITAGTIEQGNGVYKSTDAGKTWRHLGLDRTKHIPSISVDPRNADVLLLAATGDPHRKSEERRIERVSPKTGRAPPADSFHPNDLPLNHSVQRDQQPGDQWTEIGLPVPTRHEDHNRDLEPTQVLLEAEIAVHRDEHIESILRERQQRPVLFARPTGLRHGLDFVAR